MEPAVREDVLAVHDDGGKRGRRPLVDLDRLDRRDARSGGEPKLEQ